MRSSAKNRQRFRRGALAASCLLSVAVVVTPVAAGAASARIVVGDGAPLGAHAHVVALPRTTSFDVSLTPSHSVAMRALVSEVSTPSSPMYRHFLSRGEFARRFAPSASSVSAVARYFRGYGLRVSAVAPGGMLLHVAGSPRAIERAFNARLAAVRRADGVVATQFNSTATLPASLARVVNAVAGLTTWRGQHFMSRTGQRLTRAHLVTPSNNCAPAQNVQGSAATNRAFLPVQQAAAYGIDKAWANGFNGAGETIGVYEVSSTHTNWAPYFSCYGLTRNIKIVNSIDGGPTNDYSGQEEVDLDIEETGVLAPGATIIDYQGPNSGSGPIDVFAKMALDDVASVITTSWGGCELTETSSGDMKSEQLIFAQMALQGQTVFSASGDNGSSDCYNSTGLSVDDPASQPLVTGVGGLTVHSIATATTSLSQGVWNHGGGGGGGGVSAYWPQPTWQTGGTVPTNAKRLVPDLSVMADPQTGFIDYTGASGSWYTVGGTSIGSPIMAAVVATAEEACGTKMGSINPTIYQMSANGIGFNDVTVGNNSIPGTGTNGKFAAGVGYDMASGLGSPDPSSFINSLCTDPISASTSSVVQIPNVAPADLTTGALVTVTAQRASSTPVDHAVPVLSLSETGALPLAVPLGTVTDANGQMTFRISTNVPGVVHVAVSVLHHPIASTNVTFTSSITANDLSTTSISSPAAAQRVALTSAGARVAVGITASRLIVERTFGATRTTNLSAAFHLRVASGAPALSCALSSCLAAIDVGGHLGIITNVNTPAAATYQDLGTHSRSATGVLADSLSIVDGRANNFYDVSYLTSGGRVMLAHVNTMTQSVTYSDLSARFSLGTASGATALVSDNASQRYVAVRIGSAYWLIADGLARSAVNVAASSHFNVSGTGALSGAPRLIRDVGNANELELLGRTSGGSVVLFNSTPVVPNVVSSYTVIATNASAESFVAGATPSSRYDVLFVDTNGVEIALNVGAWFNVSVSALTAQPLNGPSLTGGSSPLVVSGSRYYNVRV